MVDVIEMIKDKLSTLEKEAKTLNEELKEYDAYTPDEYRSEVFRSVALDAKVEILKELLEDLSEEDI